LASPENCAWKTVPWPGQGGSLSAAESSGRLVEPKLGKLAQDARQRRFSIWQVTLSCCSSPPADVAWNPGAVLVISNWNGSVYGAEPIGCSPGRILRDSLVTQSAQLVFANPGGVPAGNYPARMLVTGEIVPRTGPVLEFTRTPSALVFSWVATTGCSPQRTSKGLTS
jgi:hypothetical protein